MNKLNTAFEPIHRQPHKNPSERNTPAGVGASMYRLLFCPKQLNDRPNGILRHDLHRGASETTPLKRGRNTIWENGKAGWRQIAVIWIAPNHHDGKNALICRHYSDSPVAWRQNCRHVPSLSCGIIHDAIFVRSSNGITDDATTVNTLKICT